MKCQVCHAEAGADATFCPHCGAKLAGIDSKAATSAAAPAVVEEASGATAGAALGGRRRAVDVPEETLWEGRYSPKAMLGSIVGAAIASLALLIVAGLLGDSDFWGVPLAGIAVIWLLVAVRFAHTRLGIHYKLTNQMFYHQHGVLTRVSNRVEAIDINDVTYVQGLLDRLMNVGKIRIASSDQTNGTLWVEGVENVQDVAKLIDKARRAERIRRGVSVESIGSGAPSQ